MASNPPITFGGELQPAAADAKPHILRFLQATQPYLEEHRVAGAQFFAAMRKMDAMGERRSSPEPPGKLSDDLKSDEEPSLRAQTTSSLPRSSRPGGLAKRMRGKDETPPSTSQNALVKTDSIEKIVDQDKQAEQAFLASVQAKQPQPVKATTKAKAPLKKSSVGASSPAEKVLEERKTAPTPSKAAKQAKKCNVDKENDPSSEAIVPHSQLLEQRRQRRRAKESILKPGKPAPKRQRANKPRQPSPPDSESEHSQIVVSSRAFASLDDELKRKGRGRGKNVGLKMLAEYEPRVTRGRITLGPAPPGISAKSIGSQRIKMAETAQRSADRETGQAVPSRTKKRISTKRARRDRSDSSTSLPDATRTKWRKKPVLDVHSSATSWSDSEMGGGCIQPDEREDNKHPRKPFEMPQSDSGPATTHPQRSPIKSPEQDTEQEPAPSRFFRPPERSLAKRSLDAYRNLQQLPEQEAGMQDSQPADHFLAHYHSVDEHQTHYAPATFAPPLEQSSYELDERCVGWHDDSAAFDFAPVSNAQLSDSPLDVFGTSFEQAKKQLWVGKPMRR